MMKKSNQESDKQKNLTKNVVSIFTGEKLHGHSANPIVRIAPELDGLQMLYSNKAHPEKRYSLKIACWALRADESVQGMVPWLNQLMPCTEINDPLEGFWQGYLDPRSGHTFYHAPDYKVQELQAAARHFAPEGAKKIAVQEIPDTIGTHAALTHNGFKTLTLIEIHSWKLKKDGSVSGMFVDYPKARTSPVLNGDKALVEAESRSDFRYFFQHQMANKIKNQDPDAMAAISLLMENH